jgi:DNA-binding SARP family transcriptional activator
MWPFVAAQVGRDTLKVYQDAPEVGLRVRRALAALPPLGTPAPHLVIRCLGPLEVRRGVTVLPPSVWKRMSARRLLQFLLVQDRPVHREEIMDALWPDLDPRRAANHLRVALSHLRRVLEPGTGQPAAHIAAAGSTVALARDRVHTDLERFRSALTRAADSSGAPRREALVEAVETYQGDLFADSPYEEWAALHRERLAQQYHGALAALAALEEEDERWEAALTRWTALLDRDPAAEHAHRGRMRCHLALGRTSDALRAFEECRRALADLGATLSIETLRLRDRIPAATL